MKQKDKSVNLSKKESKMKSKSNTPRDLTYPASEDIYNQDKEETDINPEDITKTSNEKIGAKNEKDFEDDKL